MKIFLIVVLLWVPTLSLAWGADETVNVTPWIGDVPAQAEFQRGLLDFGPGAPMGSAHLKGSGLFSAYSIDDCGAIGSSLLKRLSNLDQYILYAKTSKGTPLYFADRLFYLVSIDRPAIAVVPNKFSFKHEPDRVGGRNPYFNDELMYQYNALRAREIRLLLRAYSAGMPEWTNHLELSAVVPAVEGIQVLSDKWPHEVSLAQAISDPQWPFTTIESARFPGYLEFVLRKQAASAAPKSP